MDRFDDIPETALEWHRAGKGAALATVVETWGSAPRRVGSQLAISGQGEIAGSVSGGCVEGAVVAEALDAIEDGKPLLLEYGVSDGDAFAVGLACGGTIRVLVEPVGPVMPVEVLEDLVAARAAREPVAYVTGGGGMGHLIREGFDDRFRLDRSGFEADGGTFVAVHNPPLRLIIVGAVHIAQPLAEMASMAGYDVTLIDPREAFATEARFPGRTLIHDWPDEALETLAPDARTAIVLLSHDPKFDDPALAVALPSAAFYVGALGSRRTQAKRQERLLAAGMSPEVLARLSAPVGLDIGAATPAEIAISVLAEMTGALRRPA